MNINTSQLPPKKLHPLNPDFEEPQLT